MFAQRLLTVCRPTEAPQQSIHALQSPSIFRHNELVWPHRQHHTTWSRHSVWMQTIMSPPPREQHHAAGKEGFAFSPVVIVFPHAVFGSSLVLALCFSLELFVFRPPLCSVGSLVSPILSLSSSLLSLCFVVSSVCTLILPLCPVCSPLCSLLSPSFSFFTFVFFFFKSCVSCGRLPGSSPPRFGSDEDVGREKCIAARDLHMAVHARIALKSARQHRERTRPQRQVSTVWYTTQSSKHLSRIWVQSSEQIF